VGMLAGQDVQGKIIIPAQFDYFEISSPQ